MGGELKLLLEIIDFQSKDELLAKLRELRNSAVRIASEHRMPLKEMIGIAIQQIYYSSERNLLHYKAFLNKKLKTEDKNE